MWQPVGIAVVKWLEHLWSRAIHKIRSPSAVIICIGTHWMPLVQSKSSMLLDFLNYISWNMFGPSISWKFSKNKQNLMTVQGVTKMIRPYKRNLLSPCWWCNLLMLPCTGHTVHWGLWSVHRLLQMVQRVSHSNTTQKQDGSGSDLFDVNGVSYGDGGRSP